MAGSVAYQTRGSLPWPNPYGPNVRRKMPANWQCHGQSCVRPHKVGGSKDAGPADRAWPSTSENSIGDAVDRAHVGVGRAESCERARLCENDRPCARPMETGRRRRLVAVRECCRGRKRCRRGEQAPARDGRGRGGFRDAARLAGCSRGRGASGARRSAVRERDRGRRENDDLVHEAPAIVGRQTPSALTHSRTAPAGEKAHAA